MGKQHFEVLPLWNILRMLIMPSRFHRLHSHSFHRSQGHQNTLQDVPERVATWKGIQFLKLPFLTHKDRCKLEA